MLMAAYQVMTEGGVDAVKIIDITNQADVGFGTFYNYFQSKDALAHEVLDCLIINITTGGNTSKPPDERLVAALAFSPEMCSLNLGRMNEPSSLTRFEAWAVCASVDACNRSGIDTGMCGRY